MKLSIIIVNDHDLHTLQQCVNSFIQNTPSFNYQIFIRDNSGNKDCIEYIMQLPAPFVPLEPSNTPVSFTKIYNIVIPESAGEFFLFFDSDAYLLPGGTLDKCVSFMEAKPEIGVLTCKLLRSDGTVDKGCRRSIPTLWSALCRFTKLADLFPESAFFSGYRMSYLDDNINMAMECAYLPFMMVRRTVFEQIGLMYEELYKYGADMDFSIRARKNGWQIFYYAEAQAIHDSIMIDKLRTKMRVESIKTISYLFDRHFKESYGLLGIFLSLMLNSTYKLVSQISKY